ncbi:MAG TPA: polyribonucleotide nucleotidyltransferase [Bryobacteraceae bacterium]|nr:polyribonucleotide nucleotidyltransferase [Bryobacteraceae bacterium]
MKLHKVEVELDGMVLSMETGKLAKQASGAVIVRWGDSVVLVTACAAPRPKPNQGFFPLTCDYREFTYSAGKIPGGYIKREGRMSEKETLTSRMIDRPLRPLFPEGYLNETQIIAMVISADPEHDPGVLGIVGAGAALAISDIPFEHLVSAVRVGMIDGKYKVNPSYTETRASKLNIIVAGSESGLVMVEAGAQQVSEDEVLGALEYGHQACKKIIDALKTLVKDAGKTKKVFTPKVLNTELLAQIDKKIRVDLTDAMNTKKYEKLESYARIDALHDKVMEEAEEGQKEEAGKLFDVLKEKIFRDEMLDVRRRPDGRAFDEVRSIWGEAGVLPRTHGSAVFTRGETQALVTVTLGTKDDEQRIELLEPGESFKRFMLHYNFPPFSVGETGFMRGPGRREIGHGALAERAVSAILPDEAKFPYTLRVVSDILESNGSSSMATVCGASIALMDAGVPIEAPVGGVAMGLVKEGDKYAILTDIAGAEDHYGDMDFKVAGTKGGITALQMDIKVPNVSTGLLKEALEQARQGRLHILGEMDKVLGETRGDMSPYAPRIYTTRIPVDKIRDVIGPGGKVIRGIIEQTGVKIDVDDDGTIHVASNDPVAAKKALQIIGDLTATAEVGKTYLGKVVRLVDFGAFVEIFPGTDGLLHISEISENRIKEVRDELKEGDQILVKVLGLEGNKIKLSRKAVLREQREKLAQAKA